VNKINPPSFREDPMRPILSVLMLAACLATAGCSGLGCNGAGDDRRAGGMCGLHGTFLSHRSLEPVSGR
jgi:hypothetical protein